jgi:hypothetical protein
MKFYPCNRDKCRFYREFELHDSGRTTLYAGEHKHDPVKDLYAGGADMQFMIALLPLRCLMCKYFEKQELYCK